MVYTSGYVRIIKLKRVVKIGLGMVRKGTPLTKHGIDSLT